MYKEYDCVFKIVIVGSSSVGKSSLLRRFADDEFHETYISTIGVDFRFKSLNIGDKAVKLQLWDTAGQERFRGLANSYFKGAHAVLLVYDVHNKDSFREVQNYWFNELQQHMDNKENVYVMVNKCDDQQNDHLSEQELAFMERHNLRYFLVSAKTGAMVHRAITQITEELVEKFPTTAHLTNNIIIRNKERQALVDERKCCK